LGRLSLTLVFVLCALIACPGRVAADTGAGKNKAEACAACHGENGISQIENTLSLAAEPDQFLQWQLVFFRSGAQERGHGADRREAPPRCKAHVALQAMARADFIERSNCEFMVLRPEALVQRIRNLFPFSVPCCFSFLTEISETLQWRRPERRARLSGRAAARRRMPLRSGLTEMTD
jgi:hypothetical protein